MRRLALLLLLAPAAAEDLTPREGSGWAGFEPGTWIRIKRSVLQPGRVLAPTITRVTLAKADERTLTLEATAENALGMAKADTHMVPAKGEAGVGETEKVEELEEEVVAVGGKDLACTRVRCTVTGAAGKRVVTKWVAKEPRVWAKRTETVHGPDGKEVSSDTWTLVSLGEERAVGDRKVRCLRYKTVRREGEVEMAGETCTSRDVPGNLVWTESEVRQKGKAVATIRLEVIGFE